MTAKRFWLVSLEYDGEQRFVRDNNQIGEKSMSNQEVVDLLNEQHETIQKLNQQLRIFSDGLKSEIRETKEVFEDYSECVDEKKQLKLENEQLKKENQGIQDKVIRLLDYVELKQSVTRTEIKKWWNGDAE